MGIQFKYKIDEINYKEGIIVVNYSLADNPDTIVTSNLSLPIIDNRYISGNDLKHFINQNFPIYAFSKTNNDAGPEIEYDNTQLDFEGEGIFNGPEVAQNKEQIDESLIKQQQYVEDVKINYSHGSSLDYVQLKRSVLKILEELNIIK